MEVSKIGERATLKSPPRMVSPEWKSESSREIDLKKLTCAELGLYMLARVTGRPWSRPFRKRYLPSVSMSESSNCQSRFLDIRIETPLDFARELVAWYTVGNMRFMSLGILFV